MWAGQMTSAPQKGKGLDSKCGPPTPEPLFFHPPPSAALGEGRARQLSKSGAF